MQGAKVQHLCKMKWDAAQHATTITTATDQIRIGTGNFGVLDAAINAISIRKSCAHMQIAFIAASCTSSVVLWHLVEMSQFLWHHTINLPFNSSTVMSLLCYTVNILKFRNLFVHFKSCLLKFRRQYELLCCLLAKIRAFLRNWSVLCRHF